MFGEHKKRVKGKLKWVRDLNYFYHIYLNKHIKKSLLSIYYDTSFIPGKQHIDEI